MAPRATAAQRRSIVVRDSPIHGRGVFAARPIARGTRIVEYRGERISASEAARRYHDHSAQSITLVFAVDDDTVIDAGRGGNTARYINHSCEPTCEARIDDRGKVFIWALRDLAPGEELTYDYNLEPAVPRPRRWAALYRCRCRAKGCRGTMLNRSEAPRARARGR
jgi:SET domain-containing protein